jgi:S-adenosylmethionine decarboxylase
MFSVALHSNIKGAELRAKFPLDVESYSGGGGNYEMLGKGGSIIYHSFARTGGSASPRSILKCCWSEDEKDEEAEEK